MAVVVVGRELLVTVLRSMIEGSGGDFSAKMAGKLKMWFQCFAVGSCLVALALKKGDPETARAIGVGLSPGDETYDQPYLYVNPWPPAAPRDLPDLPVPGRWHTKGFVGAVALGEDIVASTEKRKAVVTFLNGAVGAGRGLSIEP